MSKINYKSDIEKLIPANSQSIEGAYAHMIGVMGMRYLKAKESAELHVQIETARDLWAMIELINLQTIFLSNATHASIAIGNEMRRITDLLEADFGIDLLRDATKERTFMVVRLNDDSMTNWHDEIVKRVRLNTFV